MMKWEISCDGWYPYCPVCKYEPVYRGPICPKCGARLEPDTGDMKRLKDEKPILYQAIIDFVKQKSEGSNGT